MEEIISCPFCGGKSVLFVSKANILTNFYDIRCTKCSIRTHICGTQTEVIAFWNNRFDFEKYNKEQKTIFEEQRVISFIKAVNKKYPDLKIEYIYTDAGDGDYFWDITHDNLLLENDKKFRVWYSNLYLKYFYKNDKYIPVCFGISTDVLVEEHFDNVKR